MKNLSKIKIGIILVINTYFVCRWIQEAASTNEVGKQWINIIFPVLMLIFSGIVLVIFKIIEFLRKNKKIKEEI